MALLARGGIGVRGQASFLPHREIPVREERSARRWPELFESQGVRKGLEVGVTKSCGVWAWKAAMQSFRSAGVSLRGLDRELSRMVCPAELSLVASALPVSQRNLGKGLTEAFSFSREGSQVVSASMSDAGIRVGTGVGAWQSGAWFWF